MSETPKNSSQDDTRIVAAKAWLQSEGVELSSFASASADASFRRYFRLRLAADYSSVEHHFEVGDTLILMDAPPEQEDSAPFLQVAAHLAALSLPAPIVLAHDLSQGFLLVTDLGEQSLLQRLEESPEDADFFYPNAGDLLANMQCADESILGSLPDYDEHLLRKEMALFHDWLCSTHLDLTFDAHDEGEWERLCDYLVANALAQPQVFVHRDFHSRNLLVSDAQLSIIDFQDAVRGPFTYDLVSLLRDCYISWPIEQVEQWALVWFAGSPLSGRIAPPQFLRWFFLMGVQRQLKAAGIFARLAHRDGKWGYLEDVPRTLSYILQIEERFDELSWLATLIKTRVMPALKNACKP